jgi:hypothetical protein
MRYKRYMNMSIEEKRMKARIRVARHRENKVKEGLKRELEGVTEELPIEKGNVTVGVTDYVTPVMPEGYDKKLWGEAVIRALRAKRYAEKMSEFVRQGEEVFATPEWQYERLERYA